MLTVPALRKHKVHDSHNDDRDQHDDREPKEVAIPESGQDVVADRHRGPTGKQKGNSAGDSIHPKSPDKGRDFELCDQ